MGKLMEDGDHSALAHSVGYLGPENVAFGKSDRTCVLHCPRIEFRHKELVVFFERVGNTKAGFEILKPFPGDVEDVVGVEVLGERLSGKHT